MPFSSQITSVDTLQTMPAAEAFTDGRLRTGSGLGDMAAQATDLWGTEPLNWAFMALCILLILLFLRRFISVFPHITAGMLRWREILTMENNMRLCRERDSVAAVSVPVICICVSRLDLFHAPYIDSAAPGMKTLTVSGMILATLLVRWFLAAVLPARRLRSDTARAAGSSAYNFVILLAAGLLTLTLVRSISSDFAAFTTRTAAVFSGLLWAVFLLRKYQIMASDAGPFAAFLYLCTVEILPAVLLAGSMSLDAIRSLAAGFLPA